MFPSAYGPGVVCVAALSGVAVVAWSPACKASTDCCSLSASAFSADCVTALSSSAVAGWSPASEASTIVAGICPPDAITFDYVQQRTDAPYEAVQADAGASYVEEYRFDVSKLEPLVAAPHSPDNRKKAAECSNVNIDRVYIG